MRAQQRQEIRPADSKDTRRRKGFHRGGARPVAGLTVGLVAGLTTWARVLTCDWACGRLGSGLVFSATWSVTLASAQLWRRGQAPANLLRFLDDARKHQILRTVGPVYQFRHARLQDRLAAPAETARTGVPSIPGMAAGRTLAWAPGSKRPGWARNVSVPHALDELRGSLQCSVGLPARLFWSGSQSTRRAVGSCGPESAARSVRDRARGRNSERRPRTDESRWPYRTPARWRWPETWP
jgi:hypothetical protein